MKKNLNDILKAMGMEIAFDKEQADFSLMYDRDKLGGEHIHRQCKAIRRLQLDEKGTKAAGGVTSVEMKCESALNRKRISLL